MVCEVKKKDLKEILELYLHLHEESIPEYSDYLLSTWEQIMQDENHHLVIDKIDGRTQRNNCYKMMLLTGSKEKEILDFYKNAGYNNTDKTAFIQWLS